MMPWPIALLTLFYGAVAAASAAKAWRIMSGGLNQPLAWPLAWLTLFAGAMCGLPLLRAWGWRLAVAASGLMTLVMLATAGVLAISGRPHGAVLSTLGAGLQVLVIRYLQRPAIKAYFG